MRGCPSELKVRMPMITIRKVLLRHERMKIYILFIYCDMLFKVTDQSPCMLIVLRVNANIGDNFVNEITCFEYNIICFEEYTLKVCDDVILTSL